MRASRLALLVAIFATSTLGLLKGDVPGVATGTWQPAAPMTSPRGGAATVLLDGGSVVVTGGSDASGSLASVEVFDGTQFSGAPPMSVARTGHAAVLLHDGRVLVVGGKSEHAATADTPASAEALAAAEVFSADTWTAVGSLTDARWGHTATVLDDGRVLIAGGENALGPVSSVEILDPATGEFTVAGTLASPRTGHAAARLADGRVLVAGGFDGTNVLSSIDVFTPSTGTVASLGTLDVPRAGLSATTLVDGRVLFFGGFDGSHELATSVVFDPVTGMLTPGATSAVARRDHQAFLLPNNNAVLVVGGVSSDATLPSAELYLPWLGQVWPTGAMSTTRVHPTGSALVTNGQLLVAGGDGLATAEAYNFATVRTDADDYYPGQTVYMSGSGWQPNEQVTVSIREMPQEHDSRSYSLQADAVGNIVSTPLFVVEDHHVGVRFFLTARAGASQAQITFTDNVSSATPPQFFTVSQGNCTVTSTGPSPLMTPICAQSTITTNSGNNTANNFVQFLWFRQGQTTPAFTERYPASGTINRSSVVAASSVQTPDQAGTWTIKVCEATSACGTNPTTLATATVVVTGSNRLLTVTGTGAGTGTVTSSPAGISCAIVDGSGTGTCSANFADNATVTLTAEASSSSPTAAGSVFSAWSGDGSGTTTRSVTMDADHAVTAAFKANQTITFAALAARTYGDAPFSVSATTTSGLTISYSVGATDACTISGSTVTLTAAGSCTVTAAQAGDANYTAATSISRTFTVGKATPSIQATGVSATYDGTAHPGTGSATGVGSVALTPVTLTYTPGGTTAPVNAGTYTVVASIAESANYNAATSAPATITIATRAVTVTADPQSKHYGDADPALTYKITSGSLVPNDNFSGALTRTAGESVGTYGITQGSLVLSANYLLTYVGANLEITRRAVEVTADAKSKVYGDADPTLTYHITSGSLVNGDTFTGELTRAAGESVGTYGITQGSLVLSANYLLTYVGANLEITRRAVEVTADAKSKVYGDADPALTYHITSGSLVNGDTFTGELTRAAGESVGTYGITQGSLVLSANYLLTYVGANLEITRRAVEVTADAKSKVYGDADPALTYHITSGSLVNGDTFTGELTRAAGESVGTYGITQGSLVLSANYLLTYVGANLEITRRAVEVTADAKSKVYGDADPTLTYHITSGSLVNGDTFTGELTRAAGESVGTYGITQGSLVLSANYLLTYVGANLEITRRAVEVTADAKSKVYGDADPTLTYHITSGSLVNGDTFTGELTRAAGESVGAHAILQGTLALNANYDLHFVGANLTITQRPVTVKADTKTKIYGYADPALTFQRTSGSLVFGDVFSGALTRVSGEDVGPYAILRGTLALSDNYDLIFVGDFLTVTTRPLTITPDPKSKVFGTPDPALTWSLTTGTLVPGDSLTGSLTRVSGEDVKSYPILIGSLTAGPNYAIALAPPASLTITAWTLTGFYQPVNMAPGVFNTVKGGSTVPLKFNLYTTAAKTTELTALTDVAKFAVIPIACAGGGEDDPVDFVTTGGTTLRYDSQFIQNWQTPKGAGNCYRVTMTARDNSTISALFKTK